MKPEFDEHQPYAMVRAAIQLWLDAGYPPADVQYELEAAFEDHLNHDECGCHVA
jgi:hypothetical protein